jgi:hypothetical protein
MTDETQETYTPGQVVLNEALRATTEYLSVTDSQAVAIVLYAAATHAIKTFPSFGRLFFSGSTPECGKTTGVLVAAYLSSNPTNTTGSGPAVTSDLAAATNQPERPTPTLYRDEISSLFGRSGLTQASKDPLTAVLREGYKRGATTKWSVNRVSEQISLYVPVIMAGLGTALPTDIRSRCVVIDMTKGTPTLDLDSDDAEDRIRGIGDALGVQVRKVAKSMQGVSYEGVVPKLVRRPHQVWRPLLAVAQAVGGDMWARRAFKAFAELTESGGATEVLSPDQRLMKDIIGITEELQLSPSEFIGGMSLSEELMCLDRFEGRNLLSMAKMIASTIAGITGVRPEQRRIEGHPNAIMGYWVRDLIATWNAVKPAATEELLLAEAVNPFVCQ